MAKEAGEASGSSGAPSGEGQGQDCLGAGIRVCVVLSGQSNTARPLGVVRLPRGQAPEGRLQRLAEVEAGFGLLCGECLIVTPEHVLSWGPGQEAENSPGLPCPSRSGTGRGAVSRGSGGRRPWGGPSRVGTGLPSAF